MRERLSQVERLYHRTVIWPFDADDFGIAARGFRQQILVRRDYIRKFHSFVIGVAPGTQHVPFEIDRAFVVRRNREDVNFIGVLYCEFPQILVQGLDIACLVDLQTQHGAFFVRHEALHLDMPQRRRRKDPACKIQHLSEIAFFH